MPNVVKGRKAASVTTRLGVRKSGHPKARPARASSLTDIVPYYNEAFSSYPKPNPEWRATGFYVFVLNLLVEFGFAYPYYDWGFTEDRKDTWTESGVEFLSKKYPTYTRNKKG